MSDLHTNKFFLSRFFNKPFSGGFYTPPYAA